MREWLARLRNGTRVRKDARDRWSIPVHRVYWQVDERGKTVTGSVALLMIAVALGASAAPALRASRADPNAVLRAE